MIINFDQYLNMYKRVFTVAGEIAKYKGLEFKYNDETKSVDFITTIHPELGEFTKALLHQPKNNPDLIELYLITRIAKEGPKIFRPTQLQFEMLEQMTLNINCSEYVQPFDTVIIELPKNYIQSKTVSNPQRGMIFPDTITGDCSKLADTHQPLFVIINHNREFNLVTAALMFDSGLSMKTAMVMKKDAILEEYMSKLERKEHYPGSLETTDEEQIVQLSCLRSALNYCLLIDELGVKKLGASNPSHYERLIGYRSKAEKDQNLNKVRELSRDIRLMPILYTLDQEVVLYRTVSHHSQLPGESSWTVSPHHRRGFYKQQPYGPRNEGLRKRIRIPPVFVNSHLFLGVTA